MGESSDGSAAGDALTTLPPGVCQVWWADPAAARPELLQLLAPAQRERWGRFKPPAARACYLAAHALSRIVLSGHLGVAAGEVEFDTTCPRCGRAHGKPRVRDQAAGSAGDAGLELSISHSGERVVVAVARGVPVGVDVEQVDGGRDPESVAELALSPAERESFWELPPAARPAALLTYWVRKEALLKATGDGLAVSPSSVTVTTPGDPPALLDWTAEPPLTLPVYLTDLHPGRGHLGCLATLGTPVAVTEQDGSDLLRAAADRS